VAAIAAVLGHLAARVWFVHVGRFFACEDDAYRTYLSFLLSRGGPVVGKLWLPGHLLAMAAAQRLGVPAAWSGIVVGGLSVVGMGAALVDVAGLLAPDDLRSAARWGAVLLVASSPMTLAVSHASLAEPLECALVMGAAAALLRRAHGAPRWVLGLGILAILAATWVRYEAWPIAMALPGVLYLLRRRAGGSARAALGEAALGALALVGPVAWLWRQAVEYGSPLGFIDRVDDISINVGDPSVSRVLAHRLEALARWAPAALGWSLAALVGLRDRPGARRGAAWLAAVAALGIAVAVGGGREHGVFVDRLAYGLEVALWPLAALGVAWTATRRPGLAAAGALGTLGLLGLAVTRPAELVDPASIHLGLMLRRAELDVAGALLVERVPRRPPFGWAAVGAQWGQWERTIWATRRRAGWELVEPTDPKDGRTTVPAAELGPWMDQRGVTAVWLISPEWLGEVVAGLPGARVVRIDGGMLVVRPPR
jgi:hypothetical protein